MNLPIQPTPVSFKMVRSLNSDLFEQQINDLLKEGWVMHGPILIQDGSFVQGMVQIELQTVKVGRDLQSNIMPVGGNLIHG